MTDRVDEITPGTVAGYFRDDDTARGAIQELENAGFSTQQIALYASEEQKGFFARMVESFRHVRHVPASELEDTLLQTRMPSRDAAFFAEHLRLGGMLLIVHADTRLNDAYEILRHAGAISRERGITETAAPVPSGVEEQKILLHRETLSAEKEQVQTGEVRVRKEVVSEQRTIQVPVNREEVVIERRPAGAETAPSISDLKEGEETRIPVSEERVRIEKTTVPTEEVTIEKRRVPDVEAVTETVKREELKVEGEGAVRPEDTSRKDLPGKKVA